MRDAHCNKLKLSIDNAWLRVISNDSKNDLTLWKHSEECHKCPYLFLKTIYANGIICVKVDTRHPVHFISKIGFDNGESCRMSYHFQEYGGYEWTVSGDKCGSITVEENPPVPFLPILGAVLIFLFFLFLTMLWNIGKRVVDSGWKTCLQQKKEMIPVSHELKSVVAGNPSSAEGQPLSNADAIPVAGRRARVVSLDVFRGICIALMIFINYGGGAYWFFQHAVWNGVTVADLVFPWFLWIMGASLAMSLPSQLRSSPRRSTVFVKVLRRSIILVAVGLFLTPCPYRLQVELKEFRLLGVLQRTGLVYFIVGSMEALMLKPQGCWLTPQFQDVLDGWRQWIVVITLAASHVALSLLLAVPGCPRGYLGPGGIHERDTNGGLFMNCTGGAAGYIDRLIFRPHHMLKLTTFRHIYHAPQPFEVYGILGTLTAVLNVYLGVQAGRIFISYQNSKSRVTRWCLWGMICGLGAAVLCRFQKNDGWIPINKNLNSISFVLLTSCFAFCFWSILYLLVDERRLWNGSPFVYAGMNPITLYAGHRIFLLHFPWSWKPIINTHAELLVMDLWATGLWLLIAFILFEKCIFVSI